MSGIDSVRKKLAALARRIGLVQARPISQYPDLLEAIERLTSPRQQFHALPSLAKATVLRLQDNGRTNWLIFEGGKRRMTTKLMFFPTSQNNIIIFGERSDLPREIRFEGSGNIAICGNDIQWAQVTMRFISDEAVICLGHGSIYNGTAIIVEGNGCGVEIGRECLFAPGTTIRSSDLHGMYDIASGAWLNAPAPVYLEPHCWLGQDVLVLKGAHVGGGSVIAARSVVNSTLPRFSIIAGTPARAVRDGICWSLARQPDPAEIDKVRDLLQRTIEIDGTKSSF